MACSVPAPSWRVGLLDPLNALLCLLGSAALVVGVIVVDGLAGLLPYLGSTLFFIGSANGVLNAHGLRSLVGFWAGARARRNALTEESERQLETMKVLAEQVSDDESMISRAVEMATVAACRTWPRSVGDPFTFYLFCQVLMMVRLLRELVVSDEAEIRFTGAQLSRVILVLHRAGSVPSAEIARMLDVDLSWVRSVLTSSGQR